MKLNLNLIAVLCICYGIGITSCSSTEAKEAESVFDYCEIYMPETLGEKGKDMGLNSVDYDWGIWGHNLGRALPAGASLNVYAKDKNGKVNNDQFCFGSNQLFKYLEEYIIDNFGEDDTMRFVIMPNDNDIVCHDDACVKLGNTHDDASPAVFNLVRRLCERFPNHIFFTSDYSTTKSLPKKPLPSNSGVLISAMDYPRTAFTTPEEMAFMQRIANWKKNVGHVYIWDYINNFDDYFTPIPLYNVMAHRIQKYKEAGVRGVFFNGAGSDYSTFGDLDTQILVELTRNPALDWRNELKNLCDERYPTTGGIIYDFIVAQDNFALEKGRPLPLYEGVANAVSTYLPSDEFISFYNKLEQAYDRTSGTERKALDKLLGALSYTRLELMRLSGDVTGYEKPLKRLSALMNNGVEAYNESYWSISDYVSDFKFMAEHAAEMKGKNVLKNIRLQNQTPLDPDYPDISIITDGLLGLPSNYHCGNLITSAKPVFKVEIPRVEGMKHLRVCLVNNPSYHIGLPSEVKLTSNGQTIGVQEPKRLKEHGSHSFVEFDIPPTAGTLTLTLTNNPDERTMAIEEIEAY